MCFENGNENWRNCIKTRDGRYKNSFQIFQLPPGVYETTENIKTLPSSISIKNDEIRSKVVLILQCKENERLQFAEKSLIL